jgi:hypothetical protein
MGENMERKYPPLEFGPDGKEMENVRFSDYASVGEKLIAWAKDGPASWPKNMEELREELKGLVTFPKQITRLTIVQGYDDTEGNSEFVLRLPPKGQVSESEVLADKGTYDEPPVLRMLVKRRDESEEELNAIERFRARVADYTMRSCR